MSQSGGCVFGSRVMAIEELEYDIKRPKGDCPLGLGKELQDLPRLHLGQT